MKKFRLQPICINSMSAPDEHKRSKNFYSTLIPNTCKKILFFQSSITSFVPAKIIFQPTICNLAAIISRHNKALLAQRTEPANTVSPCNCKIKTSCPVKGLCRESFVIYKATLTSDGIAKNYYDCSENEFKTSFHNHNQSFKCRQKCNVTELSKAFWQAKDTEKKPVIE